ncbi:MAG: Abi family protein [Candidatus Thiodiazotropha sp.]
MQGIDTTDIELHISSPRLHTYSQLAGTDNIEKLIGAYQWNKRVASALYPILQCLEISLRNAIHTAATRHFGTPDWYDPVTKLVGNDKFLAYIRNNPDNTNSFYREGASTGGRNKRIKWFSNHENMLKNAKKKLEKSNRRATADAVIAELMFGFWVGLFESHYNDIHSQNRLWPHLESTVFPNLKPADRVHSQIHSKLEPIKKLRNRLSHHEPVWKHSTVNNASTAIQYLSSITDDIINLINGISTHRKELLFQSGKITYFKGICSTDALNYYLSGKFKPC